MSAVFISYSSEDRARVAALVQRVESFGYSVWWDRDIAHGQNYHRTIESALDQAKCVIVVWTANSVQSEWVVNEASTARKRHVLLPVILDATEPPLEFRHLQSADLREDNPQREAEYLKLQRSLAQLVKGERSAARTAVTPATSRTRFVQSWVFAVGTLLLGLSALLLVIKQVGWMTGEAENSVNANGRTAVDAVDEAGHTGADNTKRPQESPPRESDPEPAAAAAPVAQRRVPVPINLLDPQHGAVLVSAAEESWRELIEVPEPTCTILSGKSFAVVQLGGNGPARFDTLAVHVDSASGYNLKTLALLAADKEQGPFTEVGVFEIPNYRNMRAPYHEFAFAPATARFVKLVIRDFYRGEGPNGNACSIRLYAAD
jgi:TIR domain